MGYYSAIKKNETMLFVATWMDLEIIILSELSETEKDRYHIWWDLKNSTNELIYKTETDIENKHNSYQRGGMEI